MLTIEHEPGRFLPPHESPELHEAAVVLAVRGEVDLLTTRAKAWLDAEIRRLEHDRANWDRLNTPDRFE